MTETKKKSDLSRAFSEDGTLKTHVGGQALLEGIMMRGKYNWSVAVREPAGNIYLEEHDLAYGKDKSGWLYWPFIRGCRAFVESLALGYKALSIAAEHAFVLEEDEEDELEEGKPAADEALAPAGPIAGEALAATDEAAFCIAEGGNPAAPPSDNQAVEAPGEAACIAAGEDVVRAASEDAVRADGKKGTGFSWKRDFGNPDEMIDGLLAQRTLEVIDGDTGLPVSMPVDTEQAEMPDGDMPDFDGVLETSDAMAPTDASPMADSAEGCLGDSQHDGDAVAQVQATPVAQEDSEDDKPAPKPLLGNVEMGISMVLGLGLGVVLFIVLPAFLTNLIVGEYDERTLVWNLVDGALRIAVFVFYIWLVGRMSDIKRMFGYHGAEHKTIHCFEHGLPLTPENARSFPRLHVRCGTAFLIMVMIIAIFVYTVVPIDVLIAAWGMPDGAPKLVLVIVARILLMPVIAGIAYEITVRWAGSHPDNPLVKVVLWPGMQMQYLTTREPDDGQIECAIAAMKLVLEREQREEAQASTSA